MDLFKVRVFLYVLDSGSLTKAAKRFNYTPSGISHMMSALEKEVGFPLIVRLKTGVEPTENAKKLIPIMRAQCRWDEQFLQTTSEIKGLIAGTLNIAAYSSIASQWLPLVLKKFRCDYPDISVNILDGVWQEVEDNLHEKRADIGFYSYQPTIKHQWIPIREDPMMVAVPLNHPLAERESVNLHELDRKEMIMPAYGSDIDVLNILVEQGIKEKYDWKLSTLQNYSAMGMVEQGLGVLIMNELITKGRRNNFKLLPLSPARSITLGLAIPQENRKTPAVVKFAEYCQRILVEQNVTF